LGAVHPDLVPLCHVHTPSRCMGPCVPSASAATAWGAAWRCWHGDARAAHDCTRTRHPVNPCVSRAYSEPPASSHGGCRSRRSARAILSSDHAGPPATVHFLQRIRRRDEERLARQPVWSKAAQRAAEMSRSSCPRPAAARSGARRPALGWGAGEEGGEGANWGAKCRRAPDRQSPSQAWVKHWLQF